MGQLIIVLDVKFQEAKTVVRIGKLASEEKEAEKTIVEEKDKEETKT